MNKQETLEEAAENYNDKFQENGGSKPPHIKNRHIMNHFIAGAKYQAERMYSEKEVHNIIRSYKNNKSKVFLKVFYNEWFEQFKKKL